MICGILGPGGCGGTFLDWSLHYLSGQTETLTVQCRMYKRGEIQSKIVQPIVDNPLRKLTAHVHLKSHPNNESLPEVINIFTKAAQPLSTFFYVDQMFADQKQTYYNNIVNQYPDVKFITYTFLLPHIDWLFCLQYEKIVMSKQTFKREMFIQQINANLKTTNHMSVGELRELLSLYYPLCIKGQTMNEDIVATDNNYLLDFGRMFTDLPAAMHEIFKFANLQIDSSRYDQWLDVYNQWLENNSTNFFLDLPVILDCIVQGKDLDLTKYRMSFAKEVVLASKLLYSHNLALKFEGVEDLSSNTMQWHNILEPNVYHQLPDLTG